MQSTNLPAKYLVPFAANDGARVELPVTTSASGRASQSFGFPPITGQPPEVGGLPPQLEDFNGAMNQIARVSWWAQLGGGWPFDATFAGDSNINGYPKGALVAKSGFNGYWLNQIENNASNPDTGGGGWVDYVGSQTGTAGGFTLRNLVMNANLQVNERVAGGYISGTNTTTANQYVIDRWKILLSGQALSWTLAAGLYTFTAPSGGVAQTIEGSFVQGGSYVANWVGTATLTIGGAAITKGTPFNLTGGASVQVVVAGGTFSRLQIEAGTVATAFEWRPPAIEAPMCQRYFWAPRLANGISGYADVAGRLLTGAALTFPVVMRTTPTYVQSTGAGVNVTVGAISVTVRAFSIVATSTNAGYSTYTYTITSFDADY